MKRLIILSTLLIGLNTSIGQSFVKQQKEYPRVREAFKVYKDSLTQDLSELSISPEQLNIFIRAHKFEEELEVWVKNESDSTYQLFKVYPFCTFSGTLGPKREQGDGQIPEGIYYVNRFNPSSNYHLSLGLNYPNRADKKLGVTNNLGGDIFIHGSCVSIGCISITDPLISQLYVLAVWAKNNGQSDIPVHIYPFKLSQDKIAWLHDKFFSFEQHFVLWEQLLEIRQYFQDHFFLPKVKVNSDGEYYIP